MINSRRALLVLLAVVILGYFGYSLFHKFANSPRYLAAVEQVKEGKQANALWQAAERDYEAAAKKGPKENDARTAKYRLGLPDGADDSPLTAALSLPAEKAPVIYVAPLVAANGEKATNGTGALESMLRFHLRPGVAGRVGINIVPMWHEQAPYERAAADGDSWRNHAAEDYLRDARAIGANVFVYGRADVTSDTARGPGQVLLQLAFSDPASARTGTFAETLPKDQVGDLITSAARTLALFAGLSDAEFRALRFANGAPTAAILDIAISDNKSLEDLPSSAALALAEKAAPDCAWAYEHAIYHAKKGMQQVETANAGIGRFPDDPRMLLAKAQALERAGKGELEILFASELMRRQPDSLLAASALRVALKQVVESNESSEVLPAAYAGAAANLAQLVDRYPDEWALRWDRAVCIGNTFIRAPALAIASLMAERPEAKDITTSDVATRAEPYAKWGEMTIAEFRKALDRRPDCPGLIEGLLYWHNRLTDRKGDDAPATALAWQRPLLAKLHEVDPANVRADMIVAEQQGLEPGSQMMPILRDAAERTRHDPEAMSYIAATLVHVLRPKMEWRSGEKSNYTNAVKLADVPEADYFIQVLHEALEGDQQIYIGQADMAHWVSLSTPERKGARDFITPIMNRHYVAEMNAGKEGRWADALKEGKLIEDVMPDEQGRAAIEGVTLALWNLHRRPEALKEAMEGARRYPKRHTFHYYIAELALELDTSPEVGYEHAKMAVELKPDDFKYMDTRDKLAKKLGK